MLRILFFLLAIFSAAPASASSAAGGDGPVLDAAVHDLCGKRVALLGEAEHGDGRTAAFKAALVPVLVRKCGFSAVFFEASHYDFLELMRRARAHEPVTAEMVASSIGGIWKFDRELAPLIPFLAEEAEAGRLTLGGLDDQLGSAGAFYSLDAMPAELASYLLGPRRSQCEAAMKRRIHQDYPNDSPYSEAERDRIRTCLGDIASALAADRTGNPARRETRLEMVANFNRQIDRDLAGASHYTHERDRSMWLNFRWLAERLPPRAKIIVWAHNVHVAKDATATPDYAGSRNLGSFVREAYGGRAFVLGFTAAGGSYRIGARGSATGAIPQAPAGSLEARAMAGAISDAIYLDRRRLAAMGPLPGLADMHKPLTMRWSDAFDALVVFREERPTAR